MQCKLCKRRPPDTILNVEGVIHYGMGYVCLDTRSCKKARKKLKQTI